jgi:hypothetical protein
MITQSEQISNLAAALLKAQRDIGAALKGASNPFFKSKYADLRTVIEAVKGPLNSNGITFLQAVDSRTLEGADHPVIDTILLHESGQFLSTRTPVFCAKPNDPQAFGSGITYSKRYALQALLGIPTTDDDGEAAMGRKSKANGSAQTDSTPTEELQKAHAAYVNANVADIPDHFTVDFEMFKSAVRAEAKKQIPKGKQKGFEWTAENMKPFWLVIPLTDVLVEVKDGDVPS